MYRTALIGTAIVAGCLIGGCNSKEGSSNSEATPPAVQKPADAGAKTAEQGANDTASNNNPAAEASKLFQQAADDLKDKKLEDASSDVKKLEDMKDKLSAEQQQQLAKLNTEVTQAQEGAHAQPATQP